MRLSVKTISNLVLAVLLVLLGMVVQEKYAPMGIASRILGRPNTTRTDVLSQVTNRETPSDRSVDFDRFWEVWQILEREYLEPDALDAEKMVDGAIAGMTAALGDPYTMYLPPEENERNAQELAGSFFGVGIELGYIDGTLAVIAPIAGTPADAAGVQASDLILNVVDEAKELNSSTDGWSLTTAVDNIRGPKDSIVTLTLYRENHNNNRPFDVDLKRGEVVVESAKVEFVEHDGKRVAHLKLSRFGDRTNAEWNEVVAQVLAEEQRLDGIVLDMRNNPGGYFDEAINVASDFIANGTVVTQQGKVSKRDFPVRGKARLANIPTVVLVNRGSASASEIVAGALRDDIGATIVGERTFGKGTVQDRRELQNGGGLHVTISRWLLPSGQWIHEEGLEVDVEVELPDEETIDPEAKIDYFLNAAIETL